MTHPFDIKLTVDTCGTRCPIPILRTKTALKQLQVGDFLKVLATDPAAKPDFDAMLRHLPHELVSFEQLQPNQQLEPDQEKSRTVYSFTIRKG
jgi:tRNA 2-thiouridine synthesizing protein A